MKKIYCHICGKYIKFKNPEKLYILGSFTICSECENEDEKVFKGEDILRY